jgi:4-aminobutyrate aminotransferase-like enzyme
LEQVGDVKFVGAMTKVAFVERTAGREQTGCAGAVWDTLAWRAIYPSALTCGPSLSIFRVLIRCASA